MSTLQGAWIWYELMTGDPVGAKAFYDSVVGWNITAGTEPPMFYGFIANGDGGMTGGVMPLSDEMVAGGARPAWLGYIGVDDVDATLVAIVAKGGQVCMPATDIPGAGRIAMVLDCCGAPFYVMTPDGTGPSTAFSPTLPGRCAWNELWAGNQQSAIAFYTDLFGWGLPEAMDMGPMGKYQFITHEELMLGAIAPKPPQSPVPHWNHYFRVADIDAAKAAVEAGGGQVLNGPHQVPTGDWTLHATDPQGAFFCLVGAKRG